MNRSPGLGGDISVLHVVHWPRSGITKLLEDVFRCGQDGGIRHHIAFFVADPDEIETFASLSGSVTDLAYDGNPLRAMWRLRRLILRLRPDIVHTHSFQAGWWVRVMAGGGPEIVSTVHSEYPYLRGEGARSWIKARLEIDSINRVNRKLICISEAVRDHLLAHTALDPNLVLVIRNGVGSLADVKMVGRLEARSILGIGEGDPVVLAVARLSREKGVDILVEAAPLLLEGIPDVRLIIVGDGHERRLLENMARALGVEDRVRFEGFKDDVLTYYSAADVLAAPSRVEGLGMSVLEGMRSGLPVVATRVGGHLETVRDGVSGLLVDPENASSLASGLREVLRNAERGRSMGIEGRRTCEGAFNLATTVAEYESLYREIVAS